MRKQKSCMASKYGVYLRGTHRPTNPVGNARKDGLRGVSEGEGVDLRGAHFYNVKVPSWQSSPCENPCLKPLCSFWEC